MTMGDNFPTTMTINTIAEVEGNNGPQWQLEVKWPWTNDYPDKVWLDKNAFEKPQPGTHNVLVHKTGYKKKKDQTYYDGDRGWMFNYKVDSFGGEGHQASPNGHTGASGSQDAKFRTKEELRWTAAMDIASRLPWSNLSVDSDLVELSIEKAERLYLALEAGYPHLETPVPGEHYCHEHQQDLVQGRTGAWGHMVDGEPCLEQE